MGFGRFPFSPGTVQIQSKLLILKQKQQKQEKEGTFMSLNIIPNSYKGRLDFFTVLKAQLALNAVTLNLSAAFLTGVNAMLDSLIALYQKAVDTELAVATASADAAGAYTLNEGALHGLINTLKVNPGMTDGMAVAMGIGAISTAHAATQIKPKIKADAQTGHVRIGGSKDYAQLINIYMRLAGTTAWTLVGNRRRSLPFDDTTPLKTPGVPETREYQARGVNGDEEVGLYSDIVTVTFAG